MLVFRKSLGSLEKGMRKNSVPYIILFSNGISESRSIAEAHMFRWSQKVRISDSKIIVPIVVSPNPISAKEILKVRYARGEITEEQFESMKRDLQ